MRYVCVRQTILWSVVLLCAHSALGQDLFPGRIRNPGGQQLYMDAEYNPDTDEYALGYSNGKPLVAILSTDGVLDPVRRDIELGGFAGVTHVVLAHNVNRGGYLAVWRNTVPNGIRGRYLASDLAPIGGSFFIDKGGPPSIAYSPDSDRYMVTTTQLGSAAQTRYSMISGDSTSSGFLFRRVVSNGSSSERVAYGSVAKKFLIRGSSIQLW